jgi:hypothetical protein
MAYKITVYAPDENDRIQVDITTVRGDSLIIPPFITISNNGEDPTDATALMQCRTLSGLLIHTFNVIVTTDLDDQIKLSINEGPLAIKANKYNYDIQITYASGKVDTKIYGVFTVVKDFSYF